MNKLIKKIILGVIIGLCYLIANHYCGFEFTMIIMGSTILAELYGKEDNK